MHKFVFRLQTKLDISKRQEQLASEHLALKLEERQIILEKIKADSAKLSSLEESVRKLPFKQTLVIKEYIPVLRNRIKKLEVELAKAEEKVETARQMLLQCKKETKTLTKLRETEWKRYLHELNIEEQKEIDEIAINNHFRHN